MASCDGRVSNEDSDNSSTDSDHDYADNALDRSSDSDIGAYMFEPEDNQDDDADEPQTVAEQPAGVPAAPVCECGQCNFAAENSSNLCCAQLAQDYVRISDIPQNGCITQHADFAAVCLHPAVLDVAWLWYKQQYDEPYEGPLFDLRRHVAYRQFVRWTYGTLGRTVRVTIPSCVLHVIRSQYPS